MRCLLDMPVSMAHLNVLETHKHKGVHAHQIGKGRAPDSKLLEIARQEGRVVITTDLDFPRLLALSSAAGPGLILFRSGNYSGTEMYDLLERALREVPPSTLEVSICVVDKNRIRITQLPLKRVS